MSYAEATGLALAGFSEPETGLDRAVVEAIATAHGAEVIRRFTRRFGARGGGMPEGVAGFLSAWASEGARELDDLWCLPVGRAHSALAGEPSVDPLEVAAELALWATERGAPGQWSLRLVRPSQLRLHGFVYDDVLSLEVESDGRTISLTATHADGSPTQARHVREGPRWRGDRGLACPVVPIGGSEVTLLFREHLSSPAFDGLRSEALAAGEVESATELLRSAAEFLDVHSSSYARWTGGLLRTLIPLCGDTPDAIRSGSSVAEPGLSHMSFRCTPAALAEMLVHETTHQYYYLATRVGGVDDGRDPTLYYSPVKQQGRPLCYILIAYHAFGNVLLFSRECLERGYADPDGYVRRYVEVLSRWVRELEEPLRSSPALTALGHALWRPIAARLGRTSP